MKLFIKIKPNSKQSKIEQLDNKNYIIWIKEPPIENKANLELIKALSKHLKIPKSNIKIVKGIKSKNKVIEIEK
jgi:uncharacterized protein